jgi:hypothetical protein
MQKPAWVNWWEEEARGFASQRKETTPEGLHLVASKAGISMQHAIADTHDEHIMLAAQIYDT